MHYENAIFQHSAHQNDTSNLDFHSEMYTSTEELDAYFADAKKSKPYLFVNICMRWGILCGDTEDYFKLWKDMLALVVALCGSGAIIPLFAKLKQDGLWRGF